MINYQSTFDAPITRPCLFAVNFNLPVSLFQFSSLGVWWGWLDSSEAGSLLLMQCIFSCARSKVKRFELLFLFSLTDTNSKLVSLTFPLEEFKFKQLMIIRLNYSIRRFLLPSTGLDPEHTTWQDFPMCVS